jgi:SpoVK/Ycf46/Vps4 family AAA+-type ATPase
VVAIGTTNLPEEIGWEEIKELTDGYSTSDLEIIASKAARNALKQARSQDDIVPITQSHIEESIESTEMSLEAWD